MIDRTASAGVSPSAMVVLMLSVFTVSIGYPIALPLLPHLIERLLDMGSDAAQVRGLLRDGRLSLYVRSKGSANAQ